MMVLLSSKCYQYPPILFTVKANIFTVSYCYLFSSTWTLVPQTSKPGLPQPHALCTCCLLCLCCSSPRQPNGLLPHQLQVFIQISTYLWGLSEGWLEKNYGTSHNVKQCSDFLKNRMLFRCQYGKMSRTYCQVKKASTY